MVGKKYEEQDTNKETQTENQTRRKDDGKKEVKEQQTNIT